MDTKEDSQLRAFCGYVGEYSSYAFHDTARHIAVGATWIHPVPGPEQSLPLAFVVSA